MRFIYHSLNLVIIQYDLYCENIENNINKKIYRILPFLYRPISGFFTTRYYSQQVAFHHQPLGSYP